MAIDFGNTIMEGQIAPSVQVQAPVQDNTAAVFGDALQSVGNTAGKIFGTMIAGNIANERAGILSEVNNRWLDIADAVDQGALSQQQARMLIRQSFREYTANDPTLYEDLNKLHATFLTSSGMGHIIDEGTPEQQAFDAIRLESAKLGITIDQYMQQQAAMNELSILNKRVEYMQAQGNLITERDKLDGINISTNLARTSYPIAQAQVQDAMRRIEANPNLKPQIVQELNDWFGAQISQWQALTGPMNIDYIVTPVAGLRDTFNSWANDTVSTANMQATITNTQVKYDLMYQTNPDIARWITEASILNDVGLADSMGQHLWNRDSIQKLFENIGPNARKPADLFDGSEASTIVISNTRQMASSLIKSTNEEARREFLTHISRMIDGVYTNSIGVDDPLTFKNIIEELGSHEVRAFIDSMGGIDSRYATQATDVIRQQYESALLPAMQNVWYQENTFHLSNTPGGITAPDRFGSNLSLSSQIASGSLLTSEVAEPRWNGSAVEFMVKEQYRDVPEITAFVRDLNTGSNSLAIPLNNLINVYSTMTGQQPADVYKNDLEWRIFGVSTEGQSQTNVTAPSISDRTNQLLNDTALDNVQPFRQDGLDAIQQVLGQADPARSVEALSYVASPTSLTMADFNGSVENVVQVIRQTQAKDAQMMANATSPIEVAAGYLGLSEERNNDNVTLSRFIRTAAGIDIDPAKTAWCAAFIDAVLHASGQGGGTGKLNARSYLDWGTPVTTPVRGDVVVISRGNPNGWEGHVGFFEGYDENGNIRILGGNQSNQVSVQSYPADRLLGFRRAI